MSKPVRKPSKLFEYFLTLEDEDNSEARPKQTKKQRKFIEARDKDIREWEDRLEEQYECRH